MREQEIDEIKNATKRELNMLDNEISYTIEELGVNLTDFRTKMSLLWKTALFWKSKRIKIISKIKTKWNRKTKRRSEK